MYEAQRKAMNEIWSDPVRKAEVIKNMKIAGIKRRKHKDIEVSQVDDPVAYSREYQRKWRASHPTYYAEKSRARRLKRKEEEMKNEGKN